MKRIPLMVRLDKRTVVVVGGGRVAARKVPHLISAGAQVTIIAPALHHGLQVLLDTGQIDWKNAEVQNDESFIADILVIATDQRALNQSLYANRKSGQWVYIVDDPGKSDFHFPTVIDKGRLTLTISTGGASPTYAKRLKKKLEAFITREVELDLQFLEQARVKILSTIQQPHHRKALLQQISSEDFLRNANRADLLEQKIQLLQMKEL